MRRRKNHVHVVYPIRRTNLRYLRQHAVARMHLFLKLTSGEPLHVHVEDEKIIKTKNHKMGQGGTYNS